MNAMYYLFILFGFVAVVLALEGAYGAWSNAKGPEAQRMARRLRALSAGEHGTASTALLKQRDTVQMSALEKWILRLPHVHRLDRLMQQAGKSDPVSHVLMSCLLTALAALLVASVLRCPLWLTLLAMAAAGVYPLMRLFAARRSRLRAFEQQLPDALDMMGRALRAGHAFSGALGMVGSESSEPIAGEFRITFDEINFGVSLDDALLNLATRVPSTDLRYFVIAVILQRDTGGNLAELLGNLSSLIRARFKLFGAIRVLSAEGRLSAWVLSVLPFVAAGLMSLVNPAFMSILWTDPAGLRLVWTALGMAVFGIYWMWRIVKIHV